MNKKKLRYIISIAITSVVLSACGSSGSGTNGNSNPQPVIDKTAEKVVISQIPRMPVIAGSVNSYEVMIRNNSNEAVKLSTISLPSHTYKTEQNISGVKTDLYDFSSCSSTLLANQSCIAKITPQDAAGGFALKAIFNGTSSGKSYSAVQVFNYGEIISQSGFRVDSSTIAVEEKDNSSYYLSIPFVLDNNYSDVKVKSSIIPTEPPVISCSGHGFSKGNSCTAHLLFNGGKYSNKIILTGIYGGINVQLANASFSGHALKDGDNSINSSPVYVNVSDNQVGNLVHNGTNAILSYGVNYPVTIVNNGLAPVAINNITSNESTITIDNGCSRSLDAGEVCTFNATSLSKTNGTSQITINSVLGNSVFNVIKKGSSNAPGLTLANNGNFTYTVANESRDVVINIKNSSTTDTELTNLGFTTLSAPFSILPYTGQGGNSCDVTGGTTELSQGESCNLVIKYSPTGVTSQSALDFAVRGNYYESDGVTNHTLSSKISINYSAIASYAHVSFSPNPLTMSSIRADNNKYTESTITLTNDGGTDATNFSIDTSALAGHHLSVTSNNCPTNGNTLTKDASCTLGVKFGPVTDNVDESTNITATYNLSPNDGTRSTQGQIKTFARKAALIQVSAPEVSQDNVGYTQTGNTYQFYPTPSEYLKFKFTYTNIGTEPANSFNVILGDSIPAFAELDPASTCKTDGTGSILAANESCTLTLRFMNNQYLQVFGADQTASLYVPGYSYKDSNTGVNIGLSGTSAYTIQAKPWATISSTSSVSGATATVNLAYANLASIVLSADVGFSLTDYEQAGFTVPNGSSCVATGGVNNCSIPLSVPSYLPKGDYYLKYSASSNSSPASSLPLTGVVKVTVN